MLLTVLLVLAFVASWAGLALILSRLLGIGFRQAVLYLPLKLFWRIDDSGLKAGAKADAPVVYVVVHQSRLDPALMLTLLPTDTLHILDPDSARAAWLEPWRELGRTIEFKANQIFLSRRLVRRLRGKGRLAVYLPDDVEPGQKDFRLYRAIARIAHKSDARIVPIMVAGARNAPLSLADDDVAPRRWFGRLRIVVLEPATIAELMARLGRERSRPSSALFDRVAELRVEATDRSRSLFAAMRAAASTFGPGTRIVQDASGAALSYRDVMVGARAIGGRIAGITAPGEPVGLLMPNVNAALVAFAALQSANRPAAMLNYTAGPAAISAAIGTTHARYVVSARKFVSEAGLEELVRAIETAGGRMLWLEDMRAALSGYEKLDARLLWWLPVARARGGDPAIILFTSGSEGLPKGVVLSGANLIANAAQVGTRIAFTPRDLLFNVLPVFHSFGLTGGLVLPFLAGVGIHLYPSPLHYRAIPETIAKARPTILFGTDTFLAAYARTADDGDFASLRLVVAGAEPVRAETRRVWRERFGLEIREGYGMTETAPVVAVNSATHARDGTVGRLLPGMRMRLAPVEGLDDPQAGRLSLAGPNVMLGYMTLDRPGQIQPPPEGWHESGDIVAIDKDGFIAIRGRAKRFAKVAGEMVSLGAIEMLASDVWRDDRHAAVAVPDPRRGERIALLTTATDADRAALRREGRKRGLTEIMLPDEIIHIDEIPVLGTGKIDHGETRRLVLSRLGLDRAA